MPEQIIQHTGEFNCPCPACSGPHIETNTVDASVDGLAGLIAPNGLEIWSVDQIAAHLNRTGAQWIQGPDPATQRGDDDPMTITYGFFENRGELFTNGYVYSFNGTLYGLNEYFNFAPFTEAQRAAARESIQSWDDVVAISFVETDANNADINFGNLASAPTTQAYARLPYGTLTGIPELDAQVGPIVGDIWISASQASNFQLDEGRYGMQTLTHEIGHSLGLSHPGDYNAGTGGPITYPASADYYQDSRVYTVMSYFQASQIGARHFDFHLSTTAYSPVPLIHDIAAVQAIYGADMTTRTGDTTYGFNSNAGRDAFNFDLTPAPVMAIWDAGGIDTLDASGYATNQIIDLREGALSSIGGVTPDNAPSFEQVNANRAEAGLPPISQAIYDSNMAFLAQFPEIGALTDNVGIAYGTIIENAFGGSGNDLLIGNQVSNLLIGNDGNDAFVGGDGIDVFTGGAGRDSFFVEVNSDTVSSKWGSVSMDIVTDFQSGSDVLDLSLLSAEGGFTFVNMGKGNAGEVWARTFGNINAAEKALGIDIPGYDGPNPELGKVTVVFGDIDGGGADFLMILIGVDGISEADIVGLGVTEDTSGMSEEAIAAAFVAEGTASAAAKAEFAAMFSLSANNDIEDLAAAYVA